MPPIASPGIQSTKGYFQINTEGNTQRPFSKPPSIARFNPIEMQRLYREMQRLYRIQLFVENIIQNPCQTYH